MRARTSQVHSRCSTHTTVNDSTAKSGRLGRQSHCATMRQLTPNLGSARGANLPPTAPLCAYQCAKKCTGRPAVAPRSVQQGAVRAEILWPLTCRQTSLTYGCRLPIYSALPPSDSAVVATLPRLGRSPAAPLRCARSRASTCSDARCASTLAPELHMRLQTRHASARPAACAPCGRMVCRTTPNRLQHQARPFPEQACRTAACPAGEQATAGRLAGTTCISCKQNPQPT